MAAFFLTYFEETEAPQHPDVIQGMPIISGGINSSKKIAKVNQPTRKRKVNGWSPIKVSSEDMKGGKGR
jgi:hypothetical protein